MEPTEVLRMSGSIDKGTLISSGRYAATVLMFESERHPTHQTIDSFRPVYVHHVVLLPLTQSTIGIQSTMLFKPPPFLVQLSRKNSATRCHVSVSIVNLLDWSNYLKEVTYRKKWGIMGTLQHHLVSVQVIPKATAFHLIHQTEITLKMKAFRWMQKNEEATVKGWSRKILSLLTTACENIEPIFIID